MKLFLQRINFIVLSGITTTTSTMLDKHGLQMVVLFVFSLVVFVKHVIIQGATNKFSGLMRTEERGSGHGGSKQLSFGQIFGMV